MIVLSPPPSPASRISSINPAVGPPPPSASSSTPPMQASPSGMHATEPSSSRSSPSPRPSSRHMQQQHQHHQLHQHHGLALPKPAQLQRLHGHSNNTSSSNSGHSASPSPSHSPVSPSFDHLALPREQSVGHSAIATNGQHQHSAGNYSPRFSALSLSSSTHPSPSSKRTSSPPPMTPSSPVSGSLLFSSPQHNTDNIPITTRHYMHQGAAAAQSSLPPHPSSFTTQGNAPAQVSTTSGFNTSSTSHSVQSSPRLHSRLNTITSPRSIITTATSSNSISGQGSGNGSGSGGHGSPVFPSPGLPTARPPLTFHNTDGSASSSGNERPSYHPASSFYYGQSTYDRDRDRERDARPTISTAMQARSSTRSPPPPSSTASSSFYAQSSAVSGISNSYYPYRASSPDSIASSAFAYTASNTTNSLSHAFHSALQQQQQQAQGQQPNQHTSGLGMPSRQYTGSTLSQYSRPAGSSASLASSSLNLHASSVASSRNPSRRPSLATLQSFLEGVNHVTRVRSPSLRGHSRAGSFDDFSDIVGGTGRSSSVLSLSSNRGESRPWHLDDVDEIPSWDEQNKTFSMGGASGSRAISPTPRNRSYLTGGPPSQFSARNRNGSSLSIRRELYTPDGEYAPALSQTSPQPIAIGGTRRNDSYDEEYDEHAEKTFVDRRDAMTLFPDHIREEDEQRHLRNLNEQVDSTGKTRAGPDTIDDYSGGSSNHPADFWTEQDLNSLQEGDRIGIGLTHEGLLVVDALDNNQDSSQDDAVSDDGIQFEIVRQLGYGSYAIVYLVKEVLYEPEHEDDDHLIQHDEDDDGSQVSVGARRGKTVYGREFALKCLSKKNLTDDQIAVQKFEATLHRALPNHPNVVALHKAMETPAWLFLVLEYCPGQDLFFWLEQARDHEDIDLDPSRAPSRLSSVRAPLVPPSIMQKTWHYHGGGLASAAPSPPLGQSPHFVGSLEGGAEHLQQEATPPSPSLLSANADTALLSRRRLRLISRMFVQMCEALQACHDCGVSHRDIKPENIIIVDNRAELGSAGKIVIKITDWGLGTTDERCEDFDCGSKPYMAYECRNNLMPSYEPKGADVWSLGIVLLNLLFHRCPWADPTLDDPDFCAFRRDPVHFLETRFEGIGNEVATFLANRVFCDVEDVDLSPESVDAPLPSSVATATPFSMRRSMPRNVRVTAGEFAKWASKLVRYMGEGSRRASISESTRQMMHTVRQSPRIDAGRAFHSPPARSPRNSFELQRPILDGSPSRKNKRLSVGLPNDLLEELERAEGDGNQTFQDVSGLKSAPEHPSPLTQSLLEQIDQVDSSEVVKQLSESNREIRKQSAAAEGGDGQEEPTSPNEGESSTKDKHRRRKRGARKGKGHHREKGDGVESSRSRKVDGDAELPDNEAGDQLEPESPNLDIVDTSKTLQAYAREISQTTKPPLVTSSSYTPGLVSENAISHRLRVGNSVGSPSQSATEVRQAPTSKSRFADKLKNAFANGNPELQAFAARAKERDLALSGVGERNPTASAPAKMQHSTGSYQHPSSQISSFGSVASSTGSWSEDGGAGKHWASTSSRRNRVDRTKKPSEDFTLVGSAGTAPAASNRVGRAGPSARHQYATRDQASTTGSSPSPSRRSFTPLSSFSSATSYDARSVGGNPSPSGIAVSGRTARSPLQSIDETSSGASLKDRGSTDDEHSQAATPLAGSTVLEPLHRQELRSQAATVPHILREPRLPPMENHPLPTQEKATSVLVTEAPAEVPPVATSASRAKIGKFFNKFSRG